MEQMTANVKSLDYRTNTPKSPRLFLPLLLLKYYHLHAIHLLSFNFNFAFPLSHCSYSFNAILGVTTMPLSPIC